MAKFKATVTVKAEFQYEVEVDIDSNREMDGEDEARDQWKQMLPSDFQVHKDYVSDLEVDKIQQLTSVCERCGAEYPMDCTDQEFTARFPDVQPIPRRWHEDQDFCAACGLLIEAEEAAEKAGKK